MSTQTPKPDSGRKLFFGLFIFPLVIAVGMAVLLCAVVLITTEHETPQTLIGAIKSGSASKRWQKAFELSNELTKKSSDIGDEALINEMIYILRDAEHYDAKTRGYIAMALSHFKNSKSEAALSVALDDKEEDVKIYALWSLGVINAKSQADKVASFLNQDSKNLKQMALYVLGVIGEPKNIASLQAFLKDGDQDLRWNAALALARLGDDSGRAVIIEMLDSNSLKNLYRISDIQIQSTMINAIKGLTLIPNKDSIKILESLAKNEADLKVRQAAFDAIKFLKDKGF